MLADGTILEDDALRIEDWSVEEGNEAQSDSFQEELKSESGSAWEDVSGASSSTCSFSVVSHHSATASYESFIQIGGDDLGLPIISLQLLQNSVESPTASSAQLTRASSPFDLGWYDSECATPANSCSNNKFMITTQSFHLPWSLESVVRPESPHHSELLHLVEPFFPRQQQPHDLPASKLSAEAFFEEEDYEDEVVVEEVRKRGSLASKTARFPLALASEMVLLVLSMISAPKPIHIVTPYLSMAI